MRTPRDIVDYYDGYKEESRLERGSSRLEFERTKILLAALLPPPPARVLDVGGAAGAYSAWLAARGYDVHLVDASPRLVAEARRRNASLSAPIASLDVGDARALPAANGSAAAVLVMGPLYHLTEAADRAAALREAWRVLAPSGVLAAAAISRFASALDGFVQARGGDEAFVRIRDRDLLDGQHRNDTGRPDYFTTAYLHHPDELRREVEAAGFDQVEVYGVEGPAWMAPDFDRQWADPAMRRDMLHVVAALEREPTVLGVSAHLLAVGRKAPG